MLTTRRPGSSAVAVGVSWCGMSARGGRPVLTAQAKAAEDMIVPRWSELKGAGGGFLLK
jgi:hypothetical protein